MNLSSSLRASMSTWLAWHNAFQHRRRAVVTVSSVSVAILLMFLQLGFSNTARRAHTLLYEALEFDLMMTSDRFESLKNTRAFPAARLFQARTVPGVADVSWLNVDWAVWTNPETERESSCMFVGFDLNPAFIRDAQIKTNLPAIRADNTVMLDALSHENYGQIGVSMPGKINGVPVAVNALFRMGTDFKADGRVIANNATFYSLQRKDPDLVNLGMIRIASGADLQRVKAALTRVMPEDVLVFERDAFIADEQDYYTVVKPIGMFFQTGVIIAFCVGAVVLFQVLATDLATRFREYATLKALGLRTLFIYKVGFQQALLFGLLGYAPACAVAAAVFWGIHLATRLPASMTVSLAGQMALLAFLMCTLSSVLALRKVKKADPAELF